MSTRAPWLLGCLLVSSLSILGGCSASSSAAGGASPTGAGGGGASETDASTEASTGTSCTVETTNGATLCETTSLCPGLTVNQGLFTQCGFVPGSPGLTLVCECSGYLCTAPGASSCATLATLLDEETSNDVCNTVSTGACRIEGVTTSPATGTSPAASGCNTACQSACVGDPVCTQACGC